jgi:hypothetical protein
MMMGRYLKYILACQWYTVRLVFYVVHSFLIFLSKPGARLIVPGVVIGALYLTRDNLDALIGRNVDNMWSSVIEPIIGPGAAGLTTPFNIEITAIIALILGFLAFGMLASILQPVMGSIWAPQRPLPPLPPLIAPNTDVPAVRVTRLLRPRRQPPLTEGLGALTAQLPDDLKDVLKPKPAQRRSASPVMPQPVQQPTETDVSNPKPQRPAPPPAPPQPPQAPQTSIRPAMPPKP